MSKFSFKNSILLELNLPLHIHPTTVFFPYSSEVNTLNLVYILPVISYSFTYIYTYAYILGNTEDCLHGFLTFI